MNLTYYINCIRPFATEDDVEEIRVINDWDILITFKDGDRYLYDISTKMHKKIYYDSINDLTEEQEKRELAYRIRNFMFRNHITQEQLADMVGTSQTMISRYVSGECVPNAIMFRKIAKALGRSLDDFFDKDY